MNAQFSVLDLVEGLQPHMRGRWAHVTTPGYVDALIEDHVQAAKSAGSCPQAKSQRCEHRPLSTYAVAQPVEVIEAMGDDLHERTVDVAAVEPDSTQQAARRHADLAMQIVVGNHSR